MTKSALSAKLACALLLGLAACDREPEATNTAALPDASNMAAAVPAPQPSEQTAAAPVITAEGWGPIRIGMTEAQAKAAGWKVPEGHPPSSPEECHWLEAPDDPFLLAMVEEGRVTRITAHLEGKAKTDKGLGIGSTEAQVKAAYGPKLEVETHKYLDEPAHYLTWWERPGERGVRYETDQKGVVTEVHGGSSSIRYVEGCS